MVKDIFKLVWMIAVIIGLLEILIVIAESKK